MPAKVIDASALASLIFNEPDAELVLNTIARSTLVAPPLISTEIASVCLKKIRARPRHREAYVSVFQMMGQLDIELVPVDLLATILLANDTGLTIYDASYLWLARSLACELITLDKKLAAAIKR